MKDLSRFFLLNPQITYLNFGSFGACVKPVFEQYQQYQLELEQEPVQFITVKGLAYLATARKTLANYIHCHEDDLVFVTNPSYAVNIIAKSFSLKEGDEILSTNLEYGACEKTWQYYCKQSGATLVKQPIPFPLTNQEDFVNEFFKGLTPKTKMVFISHITSSTGLRLPVEAICKKAKELGLITFVDGAHAPGQIPLNLSTLQADIYTGACHKWMMTPKGSSFLYVTKSLQSNFDPLVVSWGYQAAAPSHSQFIDYHQGQGTRDFSAFLTIPTAVDFMKQHQWPQVAALCRELLLQNANHFCKLLKASPLCPIDETFLVQLYSIPIKTAYPEKLKELLYQQYQIEIPVMRHLNEVYLRYSIQAFNTQKCLDKLTTALQHIKQTSSLIES
jgi:isopenicillin-N epimerase